MNAKTALAVILIPVAAVLGVACSGGGATPTRTPKAVAENAATQTPWLIFVPVTTTPEPNTITPLPTVTSSKPTPKPTNTRAILPVATKIVVPPTAIPSTSTPEATPTPACDQPYQVANLLFPEEVTTRNTSQTHNSNETLEFDWQPVVGFPLDPKIGYMVRVVSYRGNAGSVVNSDAIFISHNGFLSVTQGKGQRPFLNGDRTYGLTVDGNDVTAHWNVTVLRTTGGFDDHSYSVSGDVTFCGAASPTRIINLHVVQ